MQKTKNALLISSILFPIGYCGPAFAEEIAIEPTAETTDIVADTSAEQLDTIVVSDSSFSQQIGTQRITEKEIATRPTTNGNITELLKNNPNVRFSQNSNSSTSGGEIRPDEVSFHGELYYNNNFIIDGMSNNDNLHPGAGHSAKYTSNTQAYNLPEGGTQSMWINTSLLKSVEAFDSNISAKYGDFTGGVINAELKDPDLSRPSGKIFYRTTRDAWAKFHVDKDKVESFNSATALDQQSQFTKHIFGFNLNQPLSDKAGMLVAYTKTISDIEFYHSVLRDVDSSGNIIDENISEPQRRTNETLLWKGVYLPDNGDLWRLTALYSPHKSKMTRANFKNGGFETMGGGVQVSLEWEKEWDAIKMKSYLGYKRTRDEVANDANDYHGYKYNRGASYPNWVGSSTTSPWGGYGKFYNQKTIYTAKQDFSVKEFDWAGVSHKIIFGWSADYAKAKYVRETDSSNYIYTINNNVICNGADACLDGNQYAYERQYYAQRNIEVNDSNLAAYIEDNAKWKNLEATLGFRVNYNKSLGNTNLSPRFSTSYDVFGDGSTRLFGGANRYYSGSILYRKLSQGISEYVNMTRSFDTSTNQINDWTINRTGSNTVRSLDTRVKTPYANEYVLGISQDFLDSNWTFKWVKRQSRNGFAQQTRYVNGTAYRVFSNDGSRDNDNFTITVQPKSPYKFEYANIGWQLSASRSISKSNFNSYTDTISDNTERAVYKGVLLDNGEVPPSDFNTPWAVSFNLITEFPKWNLTWQQDFKFTQGREYLEANDSKIDCSASYNRAMCGSYMGMATEYTDKVAGSEFAVNWRFIYKVPTYQNQFLELTLDINNVLNRKSASGTAEGTKYYKMGRNFWLGASYNW